MKVSEFPKQNIAQETGCFGFFYMTQALVLHLLFQTWPRTVPLFICCCDKPEWACLHFLSLSLSLNTNPRLAVT